MKRLLFAAVMALVALCGSAQMWVGGGIGFSFQRDKIDGTSFNTSQFAISPEFGLKINDRVAVAAEIGVSYSKSGETDRTVVAVGPYVRYTFTSNDNVNFFGEIAAHYNGVKVSSADALGGFNMQLRPGMTVRLNENWDLTGKLILFEYGHFSKDGIKMDSAGFTVSTGLSVGFVYKF